MNKRKVEIFSADCPVCDPVVETVRQAACPSCEIEVRDMNDPEVAQRAASLGVRTVPAVAVDGALASCCQSGGPDEAALRSAGVGQPL